MLRRWAPLGAAAAVVAIAVAVSLVFSHRTAGPPRLRLATGSTADSAATAGAPISGKLAAGGSSFHLTGTLPAGPDSAPAHPLAGGPAAPADVRRLAGALGVTDEPHRVQAAWQAGTLRVEDEAGRPWSLSGNCGPDSPVSAEATAPPDAAPRSCAGWYGAPGAGGSGTVTVDPPPPGAVASDSGTSSGSGSSSGPGSSTVTTPAGPAGAPEPVMSPCPANARCAKPGWVAPLPPDVSPAPVADVGAARKAALLVLTDLGLADADISVEPGGEHAFVRADPRVSGLPTSGYSTQLEVDADGHVVGGSGYLGTPGDGPSYPIISAAAAFDALPVPLQPVMLCPQTSCPPAMPAEVTKAELGLQLTALADDEAALLPAWLFTVAGWPMPLAQPAIEARFLTRPSAPPVQVDVPPIEPSPAEPSSPRSTFGFDTAYPTDDPSAVIVQYGDSSSCPHLHVSPIVKESADSVVVVLESDTQPADQACTADYRQQLVTLALKAPLGSRQVIDGSSGKAVPIDRTCARPMGQPAAPKGCKG